MFFPYGTTLTVVRAAGVDSFGDPSGDASEHDLDDCAVWPGQTSELVGGQDTVTADYTALVPPGSDVVATDQVRYAGGMYTIVGQPQVYESPFSGLNPGIVINLQKVTG
jgi:hypothetical protein